MKMKVLKWTLKIVIGLLCLWIAVGVTDYILVKNDHTPLFCLKNQEQSRYYGLGYYYDAYTNPITGNFEYAFTLFGHMVTSTFTD